MHAARVPGAVLTPGWALPREYGETLGYRVLRAHERFGRWPFGARTWDELTPSEQSTLIAYEDIRRQQDA